MAAKHLRDSIGDRPLLNHRTHDSKGVCPQLNHSVFVRYTLRSLAANRVRTAVTVVGIALATGLLAAVLVSVTSLRAALITQACASGGVWQAGFTYEDDEKIDELRAATGEHLDRLALRRDLGAAALSAESAERSGTYLGVLSLPAEQAGTARSAGDDRYAVIPDPTVAEGRLPERAGEIALPAYLQGAELTAGPSEIAGVGAGAVSDGPLEVGSTVTLALGQRHDGTDPTYRWHSGASLMDGETFSDVGEPRAYTVVGFVDTDYETGSAAFVCYDEPAATASGEAAGTAYFSTVGYDSAGQIGDALTSAGVDSWSYNTTLLIYQGLDRGRAIIDSIAQIAAVLAVVIMVAAVSLISGAFTISISERTRQFGLLSSLGASRRQLRRTVLAEATILGLVGIPLGLALGVGGAAVAFAVTADGWTAMLRETTSVSLVVAPADLALAVGLSAVTLLASAFAPALRASRVSAVDAIRSSADVRPSRRLRRVFARRRTALDDLSADRRRPRGLAARLGGMPAFLARRTLAVSAGKQRVSVVALAVSVALLVTAGLVSDYLHGATGYIDTGTADLRVNLFAETDDDYLPVGNLVAQTNALAGRAAQVSGVESASVTSQGSVAFRLDAAGVDADALGTFMQESPYGAYYLDAAGYGSAHLVLLDDTTWRALAESLGLSDAEKDPATLSCVVLNAANVSNDETYGTVRPFTGATDTIELLADPENMASDQWLGPADDGTFGLVTTDDDTMETVVAVPADELGMPVVAQVPVAAYAEGLGDAASFSADDLGANAPNVIMPARAVAASGADETVRQGMSYSTVYATLAPGADDAETLDALEEALEGIEDYGSLGTYNLVELARQSRAMELTVNVFLYCFVAITLAISVANVFNTIASGLMLRTREFAALQSAGMGRRDFRRMIVVECSDVAVKGLVGGVALATLVNYALFQAMSASISTLVLEMPWGHVALAFAVVVAVLALSAGYALRRTHALNLVEALRSDVM